eukprot:TRINITY_DN12678_c0_g2_i1.p2 TRINITY_DN12678_c0_g2~~TRINITY_DN12678_c0_g2_i1.p2  ORF type:complete len:161 (+),score=33.29 TRINITY_DN12678_c0_g2_i1:314-796(+)
MLTKGSRPETTRAQRASDVAVARGELSARGAEEAKAAPFKSTSTGIATKPVRPSTAAQKFQKAAKVASGVAAWKKAAKKPAAKKHPAAAKEEKKPSTVQPQQKSQPKKQEVLTDARLRVYEGVLKLGYSLPQVRKSEEHCGLIEEKMIECLETHGILCNI